MLDEFRRRNPKDLRERQLRLQAAVYLRARAESWLQQRESTPTDDQARSRAIEDLDLAIDRLRALNEKLFAESDAVSQNVRYRLAQSLADRAELEPPDSMGQRDRGREALKALDRPIDDPGSRATRFCSGATPRSARPVGRGSGRNRIGLES